VDGDSDPGWGLIPSGEEYGTWMILYGKARSDDQPERARSLPASVWVS